MVNQRAAVLNRVPCVSTRTSPFMRKKYTGAIVQAASARPQGFLLPRTAGSSLLLSREAPLRTEALWLRVNSIKCICGTGRFSHAALAQSSSSVRCSLFDYDRRNRPGTPRMVYPSLSAAFIWRENLKPDNGRSVVATSFPSASTWNARPSISGCRSVCSSRLALGESSG